MRVLIENYRGFYIWFDTSNETFYAASDTEDIGKHKKSYSAAIKYVDDFIKENSVFEPFLVIDVSGNKKRIVGIRKDGFFVEESENGDKYQISSWDESKFFEYTPEKQDSLFEEIDGINNQMETLRTKKREVEDKLFVDCLNLKSLKHKYKK